MTGARLAAAGIILAAGLTLGCVAPPAQAPPDVAAAIEVVRSAIAFRVSANPRDSRPIPDAVVLAIDRDRVRFRVCGETREREWLHRDVVDVFPVREAGLGFGRTETVYVEFARESPSAASAADTGLSGLASVPGSGAALRLPSRAAGTAGRLAAALDALR